MRVFRKLVEGKYRYLSAKLGATSFWVQEGPRPGAGRLRLEEFATEATALRNFQRVIAERQAEGFESYEPAAAGGGAKASRATSKRRAPTDRGERIASAIRQDLAGDPNLSLRGVVDRFIARVRASGIREDDHVLFWWAVEDGHVCLDFVLEYRAKGEDEPVHVHVSADMGPALAEAELDAETICTDINGLAEELAEADVYAAAKDQVPVGVDVDVEEV
jgi:hypothetical protein